MSTRTARPWPSYFLGALCVGAIIAAYLVVGPPSQGSSGSGTRVVMAARGVVQSTVSGSGNIQSSSQLDLGFKTSGVVQSIYVSEGQHVVKGQLIATLNPESAEVTLEQSKASLQAAEATLTEQEESYGESSAAQSSTGGSHANSGAGGAAHASAARNGSKAGGEAAGGSTSTLSQAAREANIASAKANVKSARLTVQSDEQAVKDTKLYAPQTGTIVSLSGEVGETVSARGTTKDTSGTGSSSSGAEAAARSSTGTGTAGAGSSSSSSSSSSSGSTFAVLSDLGSLQLVVPFSESEIGSVRDGQPATVTIEALEGRKLAAHVTQVSTLPSSEGSVVSYDVTFKLDQTSAGLKPGMSATAEVVVKQAEGVNVPSEAITGGAVTVLKNGKQQRQGVLTGLAGNSSTIVLSGLNAGERVVLPTATTSSGANVLSRLGRAAAAGGLGGASALGAGGALLRGAGEGGGGGGFRGRGIP